MNSCRLFSADSSTATQRPNVGEPRRMSTATSSTAPRTPAPSPRRYELRPLVLGGPLPRPPAPERGGAAADVYGDVEHRAAHRTEQLRLGTPQLIVQPADRPLLRARVVLLRERRGNPGRGVLVRVVGFEEEAPRVLEHSGFDDQHAGQLGG